MSAVTRSPQRKEALNLLQLPDEILTTIIRFTFDPLPLQDHAAHIFGPQRQAFENQSLLALSLTQSKLSTLARSWLTKCVCLMVHPMLRPVEARHRLLLERYQSLTNAIYDRPHMLDSIQCAVFQEPDLPDHNPFLDVVYDQISTSTSLKTLMLQPRNCAHFYKTLLRKKPEAFAALQTLIYTNVQGADMCDVLRVCVFPNLRYLAVDVLGDENDCYFNERQGQSDVDPDDFDPLDGSKNRDDIEDLKTVVRSDKFALKLSTFKCFFADRNLPLMMFKLLLPRARYLTTISVELIALVVSSQLKYLKLLLQIFQSEGTQLINLSLSTLRVIIPGDMAGLDFVFLNRLRTLTVSSVFIFGKTEIDENQRPTYDPHIYRRLPPNIEELHIVFDQLHGLVRDIHKSFLDIVYGKCKCRSWDESYKDQRVLGLTPSHKFERTREANFEAYWYELLSDVRNACDSMSWLVNLIEQCKGGAFKTMKRVTAVEDSVKLRSAGIISRLVTPTQSVDISGIDINRYGLCPWLDNTTLEIQLRPAVFGKLQDRAEQILKTVAADLSLERHTAPKFPFTCAKCHEDYIPGRHRYDGSGNFLRQRPQSVQ